MTLRDRAIVCVGFADWHGGVWTNQQQLMSRLARDNRVLFVESLGLRRPTVSGTDVRRIVRRLQRGLRGVWTADGVSIVSPIVVPKHDRAWSQTLNAVLLRRVVGRATRRLGLQRPILWAYVPQAEALIDALHPSLVVYHCVDDLAATKGIDASVRVVEERFVRRADLVLASSRPLAERLRALSHNVLEMPNVADTELFGEALRPGPVDPAIQRLPRPLVVFVGAVVATKIDVPLTAALARSRPHWSFVLVGPVGAGDPLTDLGALRALSNVHLLGPRAPTDLPAVLRGADAAMIPYALNELTASIFPMKVYEYLAAGLPVVSTALPALRDIEGVEIVAGAQAMATRLETLIADDGPTVRTDRAALAAGHSWEDRMHEIAVAVHAAEHRRPAHRQP